MIKLFVLKNKYVKLGHMVEQRVGKDYKMLRRLGNGAFGEIYEGQNIHTREIVAIKLEPLSTQFP